MNRKKIIIPIIIITAIIILLIIMLKPNIRYNSISISQSKWNDIIALRKENKNLVLEDIEFNDYNLIIDEQNSSLYYSVINENKTKFNPNVTFKAYDSNASIAILLDEITEEKVKNNYEFKIMIYNDNEYHIYKLICTDFPIINITYKQEVKNKQKNNQAEIYVFNNLGNMPNRVTISSGKVKVEKDDEYIFSLNMLTPGKNIRENKISILNMKPNSEYILTKASNNLEKNKNIVHLFVNNESKGLYYLSSN